MALPAGWLADRLGVRFALGLGQLLVGAMIALAATSTNLATLLTLLVLGGFGFSVLNPATGKAVVEWFPPRERGTAMGIKQTGRSSSRSPKWAARCAAWRGASPLIAPSAVAADRCRGQRGHRRRGLCSARPGCCAAALADGPARPRRGRRGVRVGRTLFRARRRDRRAALRRPPDRRPPARGAGPSSARRSSACCSRPPAPTPCRGSC